MLTYFNNLTQILRKPFLSMFNRYLHQSIPRATNTTLTQKKLFILPTKSGLGFLCVAVLIWVLGTNYENNLALVFSYFLIALFLVAIIHTFSNMHQLQLSFVESEPGFAEQSTRVTLKLIPGPKDRIAINIGWPKEQRQIVTLPANESVALELFVTCKQRGWYRPPRLIIKSTYPLGLWRCWSHIDLNIRVLTYPKPLACMLPTNQIIGDIEGKQQRIDGEDSFNQLNQYRQGDSIKHIAWKNFAQGRGLYTKNYSANVSNKLWLNWYSFKEDESETRLSKLTYLAIQADRNHQTYGLKLPHSSIAPNSGHTHLTQVLQALALFEPSSRYSQQELKQ